MTTTVLAYFPSPPRGVWHIGSVPIRAYALFIIVGIVVALLIGDRRWEARGGERGVIYDIALWAVPFGLIGGRLYHLATDWQTYFGDGGAGLPAALRIWDGGLGIWGAVAVGGVGAWIACRRREIPLPAFADAIAPGIVLAQAIGRLGNYFNQELFGRETTMPWGLEIYYRRDPTGLVDVHSLDGVSTGQVALVVQPTFLYELLWNILIFVVLIYLDRRFTIGHGRLFALYVAGYCVGRFCIELLRDDAATHIAGIRINSFTSTFVFIGAVVYLILAPKGREDPATLGGTAAEEPAPEPAAELAPVASASELAPVASASGAGGAAQVEEPIESVEAVEAAEAVESKEAETAAVGAADAKAEEIATGAEEAQPAEPEPVAVADEPGSAPVDEHAGVVAEADAEAEGEEPAAEEPAVDAQPVVEQEPAVDEQPAVEEEPAVDEEPAAEEPAVDAQPVVEQEPAVDEQPAVGEEPAVEAADDGAAGEVASDATEPDTSQAVAADSQCEAVNGEAEEAAEPAEPATSDDNEVAVSAESGETAEEPDTGPWRWRSRLRNLTPRSRR